MKAHNRWYVAFALMTAVALGMSTAPTTHPTGMVRGGDTLRLFVLVDDAFKADVKSSDGKVFAVDTEGKKPPLLIPDGKALLKKGVLVEGKTTVVVHGYKDKDKSEPHEYIGHVTVVR
jgi:hypothetical protein